MKVPTLTSPRTRTPDDTAAYSNFRPDPSSFGAGLGQAIAGLGQVLQQREERTNRFNAVTAFSEFETEASAKMMEAQRSASPDGRGFARSAEDGYDQASATFLNEKVPASMREEFRARLAQTRQGLVGKALEFQYKAGDAFFRQGISKQYETARAALDPRLGGSADKLAAEKARMQETIDASDLLPAEKASLWNNVQSGLESVGYRDAIVSAAKAPYDQINASVGQTIDAAASRYGQDAATLRRIAYLESGGNPNAQNPNSSAGGLFQFIDSTAKSYGVADKLDAAQSADGAARLLRDNRAGLAKVLGREPTMGELYLAHQQGLGGATKLLSHPDTSAAQLVGPEAVKLNGGSEGMTGRQFANLWIRKAEGLGADVDNNPAFANVPYEDRLSIRSDAMRDATASINEDVRQRKAVYEGGLNSLLTNVHDGAAGQTEIDAFRANNPGMNFGDLTKLDGALKTYSEGLGLAAAGMAKLSAGQAFDPTDTDDKKRVNAMVGKGGLDALNKGDKDYVSNTLVPLVNGTGIIPSETSGLLTGMVRGTNQSQALFALNTLQQLADASPRAFAQLPEALQKDVDVWNLRKGKVSDEDILKVLNPGTSIEQRNADQILRKEAVDILTTKTAGIPETKTLVDEFVRSYNSWIPLTGNTSAGNIPWASQAISRDFQTEFQDAYVKLGNVEDATKLATETLKKRWFVTDVGARTLMRNPPESVYRPYQGSYDWITEQVKKDNKITGEFQLISDDTTAQEVAAFRNGTLDRPPSYKIAVYEKGSWSERPGRQWFEVPKATREADAVEFDKRSELIKAERTMNEIGPNIIAGQLGDVALDPDDLAEFEATRARVQTLRKELMTKPENPAEAAGRMMGNMAGKGVK